MTQRNQRTAARRRICCVGTVAIDPDLMPIEVLVRNISDAGAALRIMDSRHLPTPFRLSVQSAGIARKAQIVWKNGRDVGVAFDTVAPAAA